MDEQASIETRVAEILIAKRILSFSFNPPYVYTTGLKSPIYIDNRVLISFPRERAIVVNEMVNLIKSRKEFQNIEYISSTLSFAAPFGILIAEALSLPAILVLEKRRTHGKRNVIEGNLPAGAKVLVVEDHISTGAALIDNVKAIREGKGIVNHAVAITDYDISISKKAIKENHLKTYVLAKGIPIVRQAIKKGMLSAQKQKEVLNWFKNPIKWGETRGYYDNAN